MTSIEQRTLQMPKWAPSELEDIQYSARLKFGQQAMRQDRDLRIILGHANILNDVDQELRSTRFQQSISPAKFSRTIVDQSPVGQVERPELPQVKVDIVETDEQDFASQEPLPVYSLLPPLPYNDGSTSDSDSSSDSESDSDSDSDSNPYFDFDAGIDNEDIEPPLNRNPSPPPSDHSLKPTKTASRTSWLSPLSLTRKFRSCVSKTGSTVHLQNIEATA